MSYEEAQLRVTTLLDEWKAFCHTEAERLLETLGLYRNIKAFSLPSHILDDIARYKLLKEISNGEMQTKTYKHLERLQEEFISWMCKFHKDELSTLVFWTDSDIGGEELEYYIDLCENGTVRQSDIEISELVGELFS